MGDGFSIRTISSVEDLHACEDLQRCVWNFAGDLDIVPLTQMIAVQHAGGVVLGAFDGAERLRGFCYGFVGRDPDGSVFHYSHMTAVEQAARSGGLGARLKWAQRDAVLAQGLERIVWTYDPLESLNAYFNFTKLGVIARAYWPNLYGETSSELHRGSPTDRFKAEWFLTSKRVRARAGGEPGALAEEIRSAPDAIPCVLRSDERGDGTPVPSEPDLAADAARLTCEIPGSLQEVKRADGAAAYAWRLATRAVFEHYLSSGYYVCECVRTREQFARTLYVLERGTLRTAPG